MENIFVIDFESITNMDDFYEQLKEIIALPEYFGDNLDALNDVITGDLPLPLSIKFVNMNPFQLMSFSELIEMMKVLDEEMEEDFSFSYGMKLV